MYYTMNVSLNYFRKHVSKNIFSENIIKFYGGTNEMAISKDMIIADLIALDPNYAAILMASGMAFSNTYISYLHVVILLVSNNIAKIRSPVRLW